MERGRQEIRIAGFGGQGVVLAGIALGRAGMLDGRFAVQSQSYGAEARGGGARSEVVLADEPVVYPEVVAPDLMVALSQVACDKYGGDLRPCGRLIVESEMVTAVPAPLRSRANGAAFTAIARQVTGRPLAANMVALGYLVGLSGIASRASLEQAVAEAVPVETKGLNLEAVAAGWALAAAAAEAVNQSPPL